MTLIAAFGLHANNPQPILFGDLLLTGPTDSSLPIAIPANISANEFFGDSGWGITGLRQKVCLLSNTLAVAWSGSWLGAKIAIEHLRSTFAATPTRAEPILAYLNGEPELLKHPASFIGHSVVDGLLQTFTFGATSLQTPKLGPAHAAGSGSKAIGEYANALEALQDDVESVHPVALALNLAAWLLSNELIEPALKH